MQWPILINQIFAHFSDKLWSKADPKEVILSLTQNAKIIPFIYSELTLHTLTHYTPLLMVSDYNFGFMNAADESRVSIRAKLK